MTMNYKSPLLLLLAIACSTIAHSQTSSDCVQALRTARATYEQGRLQEIPTILENCLKSGFSKNDKIEAYRLMVLTYIYLEEPVEADAAMLKLLRTDHFFEPGDNDPAEFKNLYDKFRTAPIFAAGLRATFLTSNVNVIKQYNILEEGRGQGEYKSNIKVAFGVAFVKDLKNTKWVIAPEVFYASRGFTYTKTGIFATDNEPEPIPPLQEATISQTLLQVNAGAYFKLYELPAFDSWVGGTIQPYAGGGFANYLLLQSEFQGELTIESGGNDVSGAPLDNTGSYRKYNLSPYVLAGFRSRVSDAYFTIDVRYHLGLFNVVNPDQRYDMTGDNNEIFSRYSYVNNDFSINQLGISVGVIIPVFKPQKLNP